MVVGAFSEVEKPMNKTILRLVMTDQNLSQKAKLLFSYYLAHFPIAYMTIGKICDDLGMGVDTMFKAAIELEDANYLPKSSVMITEREKEATAIVDALIEAHIEILADSTVMMKD